MTNNDLIGRIAELDVFASRAEAARAWGDIKDIITGELIAGNDVALGQDLGTLKVSVQAARTGPVPGQPGKTYSSPAKNVAKLAISGPLKAKIAGQ